MLKKLWLTLNIVIYWAILIALCVIVFIPWVVIILARRILRHTISAA